MLGLLQAIASSPEMVSAPEQASVLRLLPIALIGVGGILAILWRAAPPAPWPRRRELRATKIEKLVGRH
jgi:hypothetical protein